MKTTGKILIIALAAVIIALTIVMIITKIKVNSVVDIKSAQLSKEAGILTEKTYSIEGFTGIEVRGGWKIDIASDNSYGVKVTIPQYLENDIVIRKEGAVLHCGFQAGTTIRSGSSEMAIAITAPSIQNLRTEGGADIDLSGFTEEDFRFTSLGACSLDGEGNRFTNLFIRTEGAADIDLRNSEVYNAELNSAGAGSIKITMTGGELSGSVEGASSVVYYGEVSKNTLRAQGISSIKQKR